MGWYMEKRQDQDLSIYMLVANSRCLQSLASILTMTGDLRGIGLYYCILVTLRVDDDR